MKRIAIVTTHPIQYYAPFFQLLAEKIEIKVFYTWGNQCLDKYDPGFGKKISWDLPLLAGYDYEFLGNSSKTPGSHHYRGIVNPDIKRKIEDFNPSAILVYGWAFKSHLQVIRHFSGKVPVWFRGDSTLLDLQKGWKKIVRTIFLTWVYSFVDKAFYVGTANKHYFLKYGLKKQRLFFAPHAVDNSRFAADRTAEAAAIRKKFNVKEEDYLILFAGKIEQKKNPSLLLQAFMELNQVGTHLLFVGNGVFEEALKLESLNASTPDTVGKIHFLPFQNQQQMPSVYQACDLFCLPSQGPGETWGLAVNEAMASKKAILVSDRVGCAVDLVKCRKNGLIFKSNNREDLKVKLKQLLSNKRNLLSLGSYSKSIIKEWSFEMQVNALVGEMESL